MTRIACPSPAAAEALSILLDTEGLPSTWLMDGRTPTVLSTAKPSEARLAPHHLFTSIARAR